MRRRCLAIGEPQAKTELSTAAKAHQSESVSLSFCSDLSRNAALSLPVSLRTPERRGSEQFGRAYRQQCGRTTGQLGKTELLAIGFCIKIMNLCVFYAICIKC